MGRTEQCCKYTPIFGEVSGLQAMNKLIFIHFLRLLHMNYLLTVLPNYYFIRHLNFIIADWYTLIFPHQLCSSHIPVWCSTSSSEQVDVHIPRMCNQQWPPKPVMHLPSTYSLVCWQQNIIRPFVSTL